MIKHSPSIVPIRDPYALLALTLLDEAFRTIKCYYENDGSKDELCEGKKSVRWIRRMEGTFKLVANASGFALNEFHQMCIWKVNQIKNEAIKYKQRTKGGTHEKK